MKKMKFYSTLLVLTLCTTLLQNVTTYAKELEQQTSKQIEQEKQVTEEVIKARQEDLETLVKELKSKHPNMYHKNKEEVFNKKMDEIKSKLSTMSDLDFSIAISEYVALIGDSHTKASIGAVFGSKVHTLPMNMKQVKEGLLITATFKEHQDILGGLLVSINGISMEEIKQKIMPMISYDNEVYLNRQFVGTFYIYEILNYYGILDKPQDISMEIMVDGKVKTVKMDAVGEETIDGKEIVKLEVPIAKTARDTSKIYFYKPLDDKTLYIQYNACQEDEKLPMETFAKQVDEAITQYKYEHVVVDLRNNVGGSDGVIMPLLNVLQEKKEKDQIKIDTLIGENTFSSALINAVMLKEIGSTMVGTPTGGSVDHFGSVSSFELPNCGVKIQYSNKFIDLSNYFEAAKDYNVESFKPDILVEQTRENYLKGEDAVINTVLLNKEE